MSETQKAAKNQTPESTRRFRMLKAALENVEKSPDETFSIFLAEYGSIFELYVAAKQREVDSRNPREQWSPPPGGLSIGAGLGTLSSGAALQPAQVGADSYSNRLK